MNVKWNTWKTKRKARSVWRSLVQSTCRRRRSMRSWAQSPNSPTSNPSSTNWNVAIPIGRIPSILHFLRNIFTQNRNNSILHTLVVIHLPKLSVLLTLLRRRVESTNLSRIPFEPHWTVCPLRWSFDWCPCFKWGWLDQHRTWPREVARYHQRC